VSPSCSAERRSSSSGFIRFEHHEAMKVELLRAFLHEYRLRFPVGVDAPGLNDDPIPQTMRAYAMQWTPTTVLIDAERRIRRQVVGQHDDLLLGAELQTLLLEVRASQAPLVSKEPPAGCDTEACTRH